MGVLQRRRREGVWCYSLYLAHVNKLTAQKNWDGCCCGLGCLFAWDVRAALFFGLIANATSLGTVQSHIDYQG